MEGIHDLQLLRAVGGRHLTVNADEEAESAEGEAESITIARNNVSRDADGAWLEPNHTHFLLYGNDQASWGAEMRFRYEVERKISIEMRVPLVLLVIQARIERER